MSNNYSKRDVLDFLSRIDLKLNYLKDTGFVLREKDGEYCCICGDLDDVVESAYVYAGGHPNFEEAKTDLETART